jgi:hypothetical protein
MRRLGFRRGRCCGYRSSEAADGSPECLDPLRVRDADARPAGGGAFGAAAPATPGPHPGAPLSPARRVPRLVEDPASWVYGVVVELAEPGRLVALDDYEGPLYQREKSVAVTPEGPVEVWCWRMRLADLPPGARLLPQGRWSEP